MNGGSLDKGGQTAVSQAVDRFSVILTIVGISIDVAGHRRMIRIAGRQLIVAISIVIVRAKRRVTKTCIRKVREITVTYGAIGGSINRSRLASRSREKMSG